MTTNVERAFKMEEGLGTPLPADPMPVLEAWLRRAERERILPNPNAMSLATVSAEGRPSSRIVLCKQFEADPGCLVFFTNRASRKGREIESNPNVSLLFHWDPWDRQARIEGVAQRTTPDEDDAYFNERAVKSRIAALASAQSEPIASRDEFLARIEKVCAEHGIDPEDENAVVPRPTAWGGYRIWARAVELWMGERSRAHDRARWERDLRPRAGGGFDPGAWMVTRLQP